MDPYYFDMDPTLDPDPTKEELFFFIFFNQKYNTQNYDFSCYLLAYYI